MLRAARSALWALLAVLGAWAFVRIAAFDVPAVLETWRVTDSLKDVSVPLASVLMHMIVFGPCLIGVLRLQRGSKASLRS